ncbi:MAG: DUF1801 domain-containing protein [Armatimonadetes bacterium]|nr:DUF1801 domain-containing protein [Armatimonadota bacterium]
MATKATSVDQYLAELPEDRKELVLAVRDAILKNLPKGMEETIQYGMIGYVVPHSIYPKGYHCDPKQPLPFAGLALQKNYVSLHLMSLYGHSPTLAWFQKAWADSGKKLDMGKGCVRLKSLDQTPLDVIGQVIGRMTTEEYVAMFERLTSRK